jgi:hypothetical protein
MTIFFFASIIICMFSVFQENVKMLSQLCILPHVFLTRLTDFNPQGDRQAVGRAHRIGQTRPVQIFRLVMRDSYEERMCRVASEKLVLANHITLMMEGRQRTSDDDVALLGAHGQVQEVGHAEFDAHATLDQILARSLVPERPAEAPQLLIARLAARAADGEVVAAAAEVAAEVAADQAQEEEQDAVAMHVDLVAGEAPRTVRAGRQAAAPAAAREASAQAERPAPQSRFGCFGA